MQGELPGGTTIRLLLAGCRCADERLSHHGSIVALVVEAVRACEMTPLAEAAHDFPGAGHSLCLVLAESHLALHTYPECRRSVVVELTVCDHQRDNRARAAQLADQLAALFDPEEVRREVLPMCPAPAPLPGARRGPIL